MIDKLEKFIVEAKIQTYAGGGKRVAPCRVDAYDLSYDDEDWSYRDSYFGGTDFIGQEAVWKSGKAIWAMNYYGYILRADLMDSERSGQIIKSALSALYTEGRFLGGFEYRHGEFLYCDAVSGDHKHFHGLETISLGDVVVYELRYHGGLIKN